MENLQNRKKEIIEQIGIHGLKQLKFSKLLKLINFEIQELTNYWTLKQVHNMVNEVFDFNISAPLFYRFCQQNLNLKKDKKSEPIKKDKKIETGVSQNRDTNISSLEELIGK
jgi:hypothetical protein